MRPPISRSSRRAPRSTSPSMSRLPARPWKHARARTASMCAASPEPRAMSSSTARARAPRRKRSTSPCSAFRRSGSSASKLARATSTARIMPARARCSTSSCRTRPASTPTSPPAPRAATPATSSTEPSGSALIRRGPSSINLSAGTGRNKQFEEGTDTLTDTATGELVEFRRKHNVYSNRDPFLAGSLGAGARLRRRLPAQRPLAAEPLRPVPAQPRHARGRRRSTTTICIQHYRDPVFELGGDVTRPLAGGAIKFVALATRRKRARLRQYVQRDGLIEDGARSTAASSR